MPTRPNPEMIDDENPQWTSDDLARAKKFSDLPEKEQRILKGIMEQSAAKRASVPLSSELVKKMQATGEGWEQRVEEAVRQWLERHAKRRRMAS